VGVIRDNQLVLVPLDFTLQLRPSMAYLQTSECCTINSVGCWPCLSVFTAPAMAVF